MKRIEDPVVVNNCPDELETMMRLAFHAAEAGFNGLIDVEIINTKVRDGAYQTTTWSGSGIPANVKK